jgi:hypothetical protein
LNIGNGVEKNDVQLDLTELSRFEDEPDRKWLLGEDSAFTAALAKRTCCMKKKSDIVSK